MDLFSPTAYDLRFHLWGYPVRVHPAFWIIMAGIGWVPGDIPHVLTFMLAGFLSILLHEYGHGWIARAFRCEPREIILYAAGGVCVFEPTRPLPSWQSIVISFAGPFMNFVQAGIVYAGFQYGWFDAVSNERVLDFLEIVLFINVFWGILNLLPIFPLDGGRIMEGLLEYVNRRRAREWSHLVSLVLIVLLAFLVLRFFGASLNLIILLMLFMINMQGYQAARYGLHR